VAKILVADDNSNIQKMVGLALKDQGIDVVAVGNGEAAVRKISDVRPDLVLADVFMPVRNGYEVCKYVKGDSSLAHIPVILLVGAFDPLDEEEAQRVGADGVLKKPFVPPDPLISMVKSALVRASTGNLNVLKPSNNESSATVTSLPNTAASIPTQVVPDVQAQEQVPGRPPELKIEPGTQAFGKLLETPPAETDDAAFATPNPHVMERDWGANQEEEPEEEEDASAAWRLDGGGAFTDEAEKPAQKTPKPKREAWTPTREKKQDLLETADETPFVSQPVSAKPPAAKPITPTPPATPVPPSVPSVALPPPAVPPAPAAAKPPATKPITPTPPATPVPPSVPSVAPPPPAVPPAPAAAKPPATPKPPVTPAKPVEILAAKPVVPTRPPMQVAETTVKEVAAPPKPAAPATKEPEKSTGGGSWFSISSTPWDADAKQAGPAAPAWDVPPSAQPVAPSANAPTQSAASENSPAMPEFVSETPQLEPEPEPTGFYRDSAPLPELVSGGENVTPAMVEALRQEATQVVEESTLQNAVEPSPEYTLPTPPAAAPNAAPDMDALVAKVLGKLSPEVLQAVTREILKPVVEAMVREEIKAKKS
jgi:CheY-like chemotaxis protein